MSIEECKMAQQKWGKGLVELGRNMDQANFEEQVDHFLAENYAFQFSNVLFKPTKAQHIQFRGKIAEAKSYFMGGICEEDTGFAKSAWDEVRFDNHQFIEGTDHIISMGNYFFMKNGTETKVEYTLGFVRDDAGTFKINLHHSSIPYQH